MRIKWTMAGFALLTLGGLLAVPAGVARAGIIGLTNLGDVVVDGAHGHVFLSSGIDPEDGPPSNEIVVTNLAGQVVTTITGVDNPQGLALSPDDATLYAATGGISSGVIAISTTTFKVTATYPVPGPSGLAVESGKLWVSYENASGYGAIGEIDLTATSPTFIPNALPGTYNFQPELFADPLGGGTLVADAVPPDPGTLSGQVGVYDVATTTPTTYLAAGGLASCPDNSDAAVLPGGSEFIVAGCADSSGPNPTMSPGVQVISTTTLNQVATSYSNYGTLGVVSVSSSGLVAVGNGTTSGPDVYVFKPGASTPQNAYTLEQHASPSSPLMYFTLESGGLAFTSDSSALVGVTGGNSNTSFIVHGLSDPGVTGASLSLGGTSSVALHQAVTLTGNLGYTVGSPAANTTVTITRTLAGSHATKTFTVATGTGGSFKLTDTPAALGTYTYTARYAGDTSHQPATATRTVDVLLPVTLTLTESPGTANYHQRVTLTAHLGKTYTNRTVSIYAQPYGSTAGTLIKSGRVNSAGNFSVTYVPTHDTLFSAVFSGDAKYGPETAHARLGVRVSVTQADTGWYTSTTYGGVLYRVYHQGTPLKLTATVAPNKVGECVAVETWVYSRGQWRSLGTGRCATLDSASKAAAEVSLSGKAGQRFRVRVDFVHSDKTNLASDSSWFYLAVTK